MDELKTALKNIKYGKACSLDNIPGEFRKMDDFNDILLQLCIVVCFGSPIDKFRQGRLLPFLKKGDLGEASNHLGPTITSLTGKF